MALWYVPAKLEPSQPAWLFSGPLLLLCWWGLSHHPNPTFFSQVLDKSSHITMMMMMRLAQESYKLVAVKSVWKGLANFYVDTDSTWKKNTRCCFHLPFDLPSHQSWVTLQSGPARKFADLLPLPSASSRLTYLGYGRGARGPGRFSAKRRYRWILALELT